jgi:transposase
MTVAQLLEEAKMLDKTWRYKEALTSYEQALQRDAGCLAAFYGKGEMLSQLNRPREALVVYDEILRLDPNSAKAWGEKGLTAKEIAHRLRVSERTVRHWRKLGVAPDVRPRRKRQSDFDAYAPYVLKRWEEGERNGTHLWQEIAAQGYPGSQRMVYRFLKTLKTHEVEACAGVHRLPHYSSTAAVSLFMRRLEKLEEIEREHLAAFRRADPSLETTYQLVQDFLGMMRQREGERLDAWLLRVHEIQLPELESFAHGVERDKDAVQAGLT